MTAAPCQLDAPAFGTHLRLLTSPAPDLPTHLRTFGQLPTVDPARVLDQVERAHLTGRGGAGFPTAVKLRAVAAGHRTVVVANGAEGEPGSAKDRHLLATAPHLVLDGLQVAASIVGAAQAYAYVHPDALTAVRRAVAERSDRVPVIVVEAGSGFVAGQETAVVSRLGGGAALPRFARVRVTERGVHNRPTLVQNVESLAHLALIARYGGDWFSQVGSGAATGTFLATVHDVRGGQAVLELAHGVPLRHLLVAAAGAPLDELQAVLIGGYHGAWLSLPAALDAPLSASGLAPFGGGLGAGVVIPVRATACGLDVTSRIVSYLAGESAKQCGPCEFGLPHLARLMAGLARGSAGPDVVRAIRQTLGLVAGRGACHHPDGTARLVASALSVFEKDVVLHGHGRCLARISQPYGGML